MTPDHNIATPYKASTFNRVFLNIFMTIPFYLREVDYFQQTLFLKIQERLWPFGDFLSGKVSVQFSDVSD
jgi:hypothetical protein